jgi:bifunctional ADP-heptose synthase (sugar kinase/adenylyltransferase)
LILKKAILAEKSAYGTAKRFVGLPDNSCNICRFLYRMDGAFDMMHFGHMNAFRQGRQLGTYLVVGVNRSIKDNARYTRIL